jgi:flagellar biosynthesis protein FlhA
MVDVTAGQGNASTRSGLPSFSDIGTMLKRGDLALAFGVLTILVVLILPLPAVVLDLFLAISITLSILILMTALFIQTPLEFSAFPTVLLISTMLRLSLNLASTRLILSHGHEGTAAAGHVIEAFGNFVMSGNFVIGIIVFTILVIVNFVVITKGSGRIAEVAARFHLDSMPGKQMAIDADLSAGLIDEKTAKQRRKELEDESGFFGAMDGASKFVRGDAIAGLLVVFINVIGGIIIGVAQQGMGFADAARTYTLLTVGDGLVTQVPALIVSTAAGLLVPRRRHRCRRQGDDEAIVRLPAGTRQSGVMLVLGMLPGIPMLPFLLLGGGRAGAGPHVTATTPPRSRKHAKPRHLPQQPLPLQQPRSRSPRTQDRRPQDRTGLRAPAAGQRAGWYRPPYRPDQGAAPLARHRDGFVMLAVRILDNVQLEANTYVIKIKEVDAGTGRIWANQFMVMDPSGNQVTIPGTHTIEPTFGLPATGRRIAQGGSFAQGLHGGGSATVLHAPH